MCDIGYNMHVKDALAVCRDGPSQLVTLPEDSIWQLDSSCIDIPWALQELSQQTAAESIIPGHNCCGVFATAGRPSIHQVTDQHRPSCHTAE